MKRFGTHIIMVSGQPTPNVLPVMDKTIRPDEVILCTTDDMREKAAILERYFTNRQIRSRRFELGSAYDYSTLQSKFLDLAVELDDKRAEVGVNLTGGTKLMIIAAQRVFGDDFNCFYVNPERNSIQRISDDKLPEYKIANQLKIKDFFEIHGFRVISAESNRAIPEKTDTLCKQLLSSFHKFGSTLKTLNHLASRAAESGTLSIQNEIPEKSWDLLKLFQDHGAIQYYDDLKLEFGNVEDRKFCQGFWLEDWVWLSLKELSRTISIQDYAASIQIESRNGVRNEIDAAFLYENRLYLIECKTADLTGDGKSAAPLYKLDSIHSLPGLFTRAILVSYLPVEPHGKQRAEDLRIRVIEKGDLLGLPSHLRNLLTRHT